ncbi:hypothetical protein PTSG_07753 [Salpingoeca rosetta]|uniref:TNFR-Cys domain-containing protein n=1 Tax=Salpingoeca rosetta (strain ATCC 50818 / BSB-021) TaxID=946362 RepID=F2UHP3_SALR5|nr:uncharacterized protein PTSG_07753 [Salpingoeca rosetta]EGD76642.1 hypothetical protein PTSG_07753 [Salpingoeca rosetta]|eukprot:XP_004991556.1 hypothetical protein PTSG_07753 [Salpingoeca rosetta]
MAQTSMTREAAVEYGYQLLLLLQTPKLNFTAQSQRYPSSDCNEPCTGAATEMCGAANRMNIIRANCYGTPVPTATKELPFCNTSLSIGARLDDLIGRLSLQEMAGLIGPDPVTSPCAFLDYGVKRLDIPPYLHLVETNTAVASACITSQDKCATTFIGSNGLGAAVNRVISTEMRAFNNLNWHRGGSVLQKIGLTGLKHFGAHSVETTAWHSTGTSPPLTSGTPRYVCVCVCVCVCLYVCACVCVCVCVSCEEYPPLPDRASCFPTSVCEEPFIETIPPTLTTDRLCSCDTLTCNKLVTQLFEEMVCADPTDEQLDVVLDVCCSGQGEDGICDTICQMDAYEARRSCPGCTDTCECSAGFILVYDADSADCRPCDSVTEFSPSIGGSKCEPIEECERGQEEVSAPTRSSDRVRRDCPAGTIDSDSDGSTGCQLCPAGHYTEAGSHGSCSSFTCRAGTHHHHDSDPTTTCMDVTECASGHEEVQAMTLLISDRVCDECTEGTHKAVSGQGVPCLPVTTCDAGEEETAEPTPTSDRPVDGQAEACRPVTQFGAYEEEIRKLTRQHDRLCRKCVQDTRVPVSRCAGSGAFSRMAASKCEFGTFQSQAPTLDSDRECAAGGGRGAGHLKLLHPIALMLKGTLDCLSTLHFIHILQLFCVLTTLTFDRQRRRRRPHRKMLSQSNEALKRIGTIAATTVTCTWLALASDIGISATISPLIYVDKCVQLTCTVTTTPPRPRPATAHPSSWCRFLPRSPAPTAIKSEHICRDACTGMVGSPSTTTAHGRMGSGRSPTLAGTCGGSRDPKRTRTGAPQTRETCSNLSPEDTRAREVDKDTHVVVNEKTLQAPFETKLKLLSGIAAEFAGMMRSKTDEETRLRKHAAGTQTSSRS